MMLPARRRPRRRCASGTGRRSLAAVLSVVAFDFFFVPPYYSFAVTDLRHVVTFAVMFLVAVVISDLTKRIRDQADSARGRERRTASLYAISRELGVARLARRAPRRRRRGTCSEVFDAQVAVLLPATERRARDRRTRDAGTLAAGDKDLGVAEWVWQHQRAGRASGTDTLPLGARALRAAHGIARSRRRPRALPVAASRASTIPRSASSSTTFAGSVGSALERAQLAEEARRAQPAHRDRAAPELAPELGLARSAHAARRHHRRDERAPRRRRRRRTTRRAASSSQTAHEEAQRLNRLVRNLLDMTRLEAGALKVQKEWQPLEEVVGAALDRLEDRLARPRRCDATLPADLPLVPFDAVAHRAGAHQPARERGEVHAGRHARSRSRARARRTRSRSRSPIAARRRHGRTPSASSRSSIACARGRAAASASGSTICRGIVDAHGGRIWVDERAGRRRGVPLHAAARTERAPSPGRATGAPEAETR